MLNCSDGDAASPTLFEVISVYINDSDASERKYVIYTMRVKHISGKDNSTIATIERRYTQFLELYTGLSTDFPNIMAEVNFPKKALIGNFDTKLISARSEAFEQLMNYIIKEPNLRTSKWFLNFLQEAELFKAKQLLSNKQYDLAMPLLENTFAVLNNMFTDRSVPVLLALCRLLGCCCLIPGRPQALKWADLALHRFDGVSDSDLLALYVPLLHICVSVWSQIGKNKGILERRLEDLKRQGFNCESDITLLEAISKVELKMSDSC